MSFAAGVQTFFDGARLARTPRLRRYTWVPLLVSFGVIVTGLVVAFGYLGAISAHLIGLLPAWLGFMSYILVPLLYLVVVLAGGWLFALLAVLIASPFLGDLSLAVEGLSPGGGPDEPPSLWAGLPGTVAREGRKLGYYLPRLIAVFLVTLIPIVNAAAPVLWFVFGAWIMAIQFCDYPTENRRQPFRVTVAMLRSHRATALGFGCCATLAMAIPVVNLLLIPAAVAGGTLLWQRLERQS